MWKIINFKLFGIATISLVMFVILTACTTKVNEGDISSNVTAISYNKVLEQGLQDESITLQDILYEKTIADSKIIFFTRHRDC